MDVCAEVGGWVGGRDVVIIGGGRQPWTCVQRWVDGGAVIIAGGKTALDLCGRCV